MLAIAKRGDRTPVLAHTRLAEAPVPASSSLGMLAAQGAELASADRVNAGRSALGAAYMQLAGSEVDVIPPQGDKLTSAQPVPVGQR